jgi:hypothetical protein
LWIAKKYAINPSIKLIRINPVVIRINPVVIRINPVVIRINNAAGSLI